MQCNKQYNVLGKDTASIQLLKFHSMESVELIMGDAIF